MIVSDEDSQQDLFNSDNEDNGEEEKEMTEDKWRKERHEREKFLQEQAVCNKFIPLLFSTFHTCHWYIIMLLH